MKDLNKNMDDLFRDKLEGQEFTPSDDLWAKISAGVDQAGGVSGSSGSAASGGEALFSPSVKIILASIVVVTGSILGYNLLENNNDQSLSERIELSEDIKTDEHEIFEEKSDLGEINQLKEVKYSDSEESNFNSSDLNKISIMSEVQPDGSNEIESSSINTSKASNSNLTINKNGADFSDVKDSNDIDNTLRQENSSNKNSEASNEGQKDGNLMNKPLLEPEIAELNSKVELAKNEEESYDLGKNSEGVGFSFTGLNDDSFNDKLDFSLESIYPKNVELSFAFLDSVDAKEDSTLKVISKNKKSLLSTPWKPFDIYADLSTSFEIMKPIYDVDGSKIVEQEIHTTPNYTFRLGYQLNNNLSFGLGFGAFDLEANTINSFRFYEEEEMGEFNYQLENSFGLSELPTSDVEDELYFWNDDEGEWEWSFEEEEVDVAISFKDEMSFVTLPFNIDYNKNIGRFKYYLGTEIQFNIINFWERRIYFGSGEDSFLVDVQNMYDQKTKLSTRFGANIGAAYQINSQFEVYSRIGLTKQFVPFSSLNNFETSYNFKSLRLGLRYRF